MATAIRTVVILVVAWGIVLAKDNPADMLHLIIGGTLVLIL